MRTNRRTSRVVLTGSWIAMLLAGAFALASDTPEPDDDRTFRPTVMIRKGRSQGTGTVIASTRDETLVLTAAHVVEDPGPLRVELHRYNLGVERARSSEGWPRSVAAEVIAADVAADVAVLWIRGMTPLPYVARLALDTPEPPRGTVVTSLGIDRGTHLSSWTSRVAEVDRFEIEGTGEERLFLITAKPPELGRSGGGLFLPGGELIGVCVGRAEFVAGRRSGVFASGTSIRRLLRLHDLDSLVERPTPTPRRPTPVTTTRAQPSRAQ